MLDWLAEQGGINFIADYHSRRCRLAPPELKATPLKQSVQQELNAIASEQDASWRQGNGIYLIRNNRWYRDDFLEVPSQLLKKWYNQLEALQQHDRVVTDATAIDDLKAQMAWEEEAVIMLTPWQIGTGLAWAIMERELPASTNINPFVNNVLTDWNAGVARTEAVLPFVTEAQRLLKEAGIVRFYALLDNTQKDALLHSSLDIQSLSPTQQGQLSYLFPMLSQLPRKDEYLLGLVPLTVPVGYMGNHGSLHVGKTLHLVVVPSE